MTLPKMTIQTAAQPNVRGNAATVHFADVNGKGARAVIVAKFDTVQALAGKKVTFGKGEKARTITRVWDLLGSLMGRKTFGGRTEHSVIVDHPTKANKRLRITFKLEEADVNSPEDEAIETLVASDDTI